MQTNKYIQRHICMRVYILHKHTYTCTRRLKCIHHTRAYIVTSINIFAVMWLNTIIRRFTPTCDRFAKKNYLPGRLCNWWFARAIGLVVSLTNKLRDTVIHRLINLHRTHPSCHIVHQWPASKQWHCNKHPSRAITTVNGEKFRQNSTISTQYVNVRAQFKVNKNPDKYHTYHK